MKKVVVVALMLVLVAGGVFAQDKFLSAGFGIIGAPTFGQRDIDYGPIKVTSKESGFDIGANVFFDVKYVELNVGLLFGNSKSDDIPNDQGTDTTALSLGLLVKFPISLGEKVVLFPFLGVDMNLNLAAKDVATGYEYDDDYFDFIGYNRNEVFSTLSILLGIGFDFNLTDTLFLRTEIGYGIVGTTTVENDLIDAGSKAGVDVTINKGKIPFKVALGFRF